MLEGLSGAPRILSPMVGESHESHTLPSRNTSLLSFQGQNDNQGLICPQVPRGLLNTDPDAWRDNPAPLTTACPDKQGEGHRVGVRKPRPSPPLPCCVAESWIFLGFVSCSLKRESWTRSSLGPFPRLAHCTQVVT